MLQRFLVLFIAIVLTQTKEIKAQNIPATIDKAYSLIDDEKYDEALKLLKDIEDHQAEAFGDSCIMVLNFEKGACFYYTDHYEEALPYLKAALLRMEKMPHEDCKYIELIYAIGSCYNHLKQYDDAEKYFRKVFIKSNTQSFKCEITTQALNELTEVYKKLGYTKLAQACVTKIQSLVDQIPSDSSSIMVNALLDMASSFESQEKYDDEISTYHKILELIDANNGKQNDDYVLYSSLLVKRLMLLERYEESLSVLEEMVNLSKTIRCNTEICFAYENYLRLLAMKNYSKVVEEMLPFAIQYMKDTPEYNWREHNLHEIIGNEFCNSNNYEIGVQWLEKPWNGETAKTIRGLCHLGDYYFKRNPIKALQYFNEAEKQIDLAADNVTTKVIYQNLMYLNSNLGHYDEAVKYAKLSAPYVKQIDDVDSYAQHLVSWALDLKQISKNEDAKNLFVEIKELFPKLSNQTKIIYYSQYGFVEIGLNDYASAIENLKKGINLSVSEIGENNEWLPTMYHNLGRAYMLQQDNDNALLYLNKSKDLQILLNGQVQQKTLDYIKECVSK